MGKYVELEGRGETPHKELAKLAALPGKAGGSRTSAHWDDV